MCTPIADPLALLVFRLAHATRVFAILAAFTALQKNISRYSLQYLVAMFAMNIWGIAAEASQRQ